jgi:hypothetical protein
MAAFLVVSAIIGVFFVVGLVVGGVAVIALPVFRDRRPTRTGSGDTIYPEHHHAAPGDRPRWPGDPGASYPRR